jgi:AcrR family transcriptional regulator
MRQKKDEIRKKILDVSKSEFLKNGFKDASLRLIAKNAGVTTGSVYTYFRNKNDILEVLVSPVILEIEQTLNSKQISYDEVKFSGNDLRLWFSRYIRFLLHLVEKYPEEMRLLFICSVGSNYEHYKYELIEIGKKRGQKDFLTLTRTKEFEGQELSGIFIHNLVNFIFSSTIEILKTGIDKKDIEKFEKEIATFLFSGWKGLVDI